MQRFRVIVIVRMREDLPEPQGIALEKVLKRIGYQGFSTIRVGKVIEMEVEGEDIHQVRNNVEEISRKIFSNPVIEDFEIEVREV
ncbi:MAG: phosphoribosylformylglycinamidine synthase subunit PurS [candidate division WOR-3 bacterium]